MKSKNAHPLGRMNVLIDDIVFIVNIQTKMMLIQMLIPHWSSKEVMVLLTAVI